MNPFHVTNSIMSPREDNARNRRYSRYAQNIFWTLVCFCSLYILFGALLNAGASGLVEVSR